MKNGAAAIASQEIAREERRQQIARNDFATLIDEHHAVSVAVEGRPQVAFLLPDGATKIIYTNDAQFHWGVSPAGRWVLFDVKKDPACRKDLARDMPDLVAKMAAAYDRWWDDVYPDMLARGNESGTLEARPPK